ncbi:MAG: glycosyltransferase family 2 protein [Gemmatimonadaceae bacterium]
MTSRATDEAGALVTVVVPSYNHREYIGATIESVLAQSHPAVQLVVIDDGSTDGSAALLQQMAEARGFDLILQSNGGVCRALNRAIRERARGQCIALLGSDDVWDPRKLERQLARLAQVPDAELCFAQARYFTQTPSDAYGEPFPARPREGDLLRFVFWRQHVPAGTLLFTRALYDALGGFDESLREEDWDFVIRAAARTKFAAVPAPLLWYRAHQTNTMRARPRAAIFHQKALILAKNFALVPAGLWFGALTLHFVHDIVFQRFLSLFHRYRPVRDHR